MLVRGAGVLEGEEEEWEGGRGGGKAVIAPVVAMIPVAKGKRKVRIEEEEDKEEGEDEEEDEEEKGEEESSEDEWMGDTRAGGGRKMAEREGVEVNRSKAAVTKGVTLDTQEQVIKNKRASTDKEEEEEEEEEGFCVFM